MNEVVIIESCEEEIYESKITKHKPQHCKFPVLRLPWYVSQHTEVIISRQSSSMLPYIFLRNNIPSLALESYPVYTLRGYPNRPDGKHRYEPFDGWERLPPLGNDNVQQSLF
ncbi:MULTISPECIES: hypothetical protein [Sphingobacterium]|uniref:hypothetical protein n=1 Tax=Sphingobacterium TaxID=28453 RepID=UPI0011B274AD|nr:MULTISPECIES: hypothetical protein [Sphingobacterium]QIH35992.1 hypothetical protein G6053_25315 [Sphingobacterium sp. DR205]